MSKSLTILVQEHERVHLRAISEQNLICRLLGQVWREVKGYDVLTEYPIKTARDHFFEEDWLKT